MYKYTVMVEAKFEAAHNLRTYRGIEEPVHGHTWKVVAELSANNLDGDDISVDFVPVRVALNRAATRLDHSYLNDIPPFNDVNPSAERVAHWFWNEILADIPGSAWLVAVTVWEGEGQCVRVEEAGKR